MSHQDTSPVRDEEGIATVRDIMKDQRICMLTSIHGGELVSRPMAVQEVEFDGDLWFFSQADGHKVGDVETQPRVNVSFAGSSAWLSVNGVASVVTDQAKKQALWNTAAAAWLDGGPDDPSIVLLRVAADTAEYWEGPGRTATAIALVKSKVGGQGQPDVGENDTVQL